MVITSDDVVTENRSFLSMVMREVDIGLRLCTILCITMLDYKFSTQGSLKKLFQGVCKEKIFKNSSRMCIISISKSSLLLLYKHATTPSSTHVTKPSYKNAKNPYTSMTQHPLLLLFIHFMEIHTILIYHTYLDCLHHTSPSRLLSFMSPNLLSPDARPCSSRRMSEHRRKRINQRSYLMKRNRIYASKSREYYSVLEYHSGHETLIQAEGGGIIAPNNPFLLIFQKIQCLVVNPRNIRDNQKEVFSCHQKIAPLLISL